MDVQKLTNIASVFLRENYGLPLEIPIIINGRLRINLGTYVSTHAGKPSRIELAGFLLKYGAKSVVIDTLYHECVHYALHVKGEPNDDGHPYFESELKRLSVPSASDTCDVGISYLFNCEKCDADGFTRKGFIKKKQSNCKTTCCNAKPVNIREVIHNGLEAS